jgi:drug/metabolite transporter superfamily protein YnfA
MPKLLVLVLGVVVLEVGGSYFAHLWLEQGNSLFPLALPAVLVALYGVLANLYSVSVNNRLIVYGGYSGVFILMLAAWVFFLHRQALGGLEVALSSLLILIVLGVAYQISE